MAELGAQDGIAPDGHSGERWRDRRRSRPLGLRRSGLQRSLHGSVGHCLVLWGRRSREQMTWPVGRFLGCRGMPKTSLAVTPRPRYMEVAEGGRQGEEAAKINMRGRRREVLGISGAGWYRKERETREQETMHRRLFLHPFVRLLGVYSIPIAISNCQLPSSSSSRFVPNYCLHRQFGESSPPWSRSTTAGV